VTRVLRFTEPDAVRADLTGGKGANLSTLTQRGFPVPPGAVVTADAYREFLRAAGPLFDAVAGFVYDDPKQLRAQCLALQESLAGVPLPAGLDAEVQAFLASEPAVGSYSVRSSSTFEDLASAAFAGQHETYLNCRGTAHILDRVRDCWLSLWADRAVAYRHQYGFDHAGAAMAVVIQRMALCDVAGVGFTINAVSGNLNELVVNANWGLGESVVSGDGEVDQYVLAKPGGRVVSRHVANKARRVVAAADGVRDEEASAGEAAAACLTDPQLTELAALLERVEQSYGFPQDTEWGFAGGTLWLLQSRPITIIPPRWTRDEAAERFPNAITPLTWDLVEDGFHRSLAHSFRLMGYPPFSGKWFARFDHFVYGNQNAVVLYGRRMPVVLTSLEDLRTLVPRLREEYRWVMDLPVRWARDLDAYLLGIGELSAEPLADKSPRELWAYVMRVNRLGAGYFEPNIAISITQGILHRVLHGLCRMAAGAEEGTRLFDGLVAWVDTKTGAINRELYELAETARRTPALAALLHARSAREVMEGGGLAAHPEFSARLEKFLADHGHREIDFDAYQPTWREVPWVVLDNIRVMMDVGAAGDPYARERESKFRMQQAEMALFAKVPEDLRLFFWEIVRLVRVYTALDDLEHYQTTRLTLPLRRGLRALGSRLKERGVVSEELDVFFAGARAIQEAVEVETPAGWSALAAAIAEGKAAYQRDRVRTPAWILGEASAAPGTAEGALTGLAGSAGVAEGPVFLVLSSDDFGRFPKGAVLVARTTNPAWTPLFYSAAAVVTESGGPLSHGAVTAREMRIPAVMSVRGVLGRLKNGDRVRVDGAAGRVVLLG